MRYQSGAATFDEADVKDMPGATQSLIVLAQVGRDANGKPIATRAHHTLAKKHIQAFLDEAMKPC